MQIFLDVLVDSLKDTAILIPLLYLAMLLVSYFSHNNSSKYSKLLHHTKKAGPLVGAFLGCIPQCGFSSVMSSLYSHKVVTIGTLFAVFIATSDEAIIQMIAQPQFIPKLLLLLAIKLVYAIIIGYAIDLTMLVFNRKKKKLVAQTEQAEVVNTEQTKIVNEDMPEQQTLHQHKHVHNHDSQCEHCEEDEFMASGCGHVHVHSDCCAKNIFLDALKHTAIIIAYVFVATIAIGLLIGYCGEEAISGLFTSNIYLQILIACLIGLIPNCSAAVFLVNFYISGVLQFAPLVAGLCAGAGVGLIVLFTTNKKHIWKNILIVCALFALAFVCGIITSFIPIK